MEVNTNPSPALSELNFTDPVPVQVIFAALTDSPPKRSTQAKAIGKHGSQKTRKFKEGLYEKSQELFLSVSGQEPVREFFQWSKKQFGSAVQCWKALDDNADMVISKSEFFKGLAALKYTGDVKALWRKLDRDDSNSVSLLHFDP